MSDPRYRHGKFVGFDPKHGRQKATGPVEEAINEAYIILKREGWTCKMEVHPTDRVPLWRLGNATLRRDRKSDGDWIIEIGGESFSVSGDLGAITKEVRQRLGLPQPQPYFLPGYIIPIEAFGGER